MNKKRQFIKTLNRIVTSVGRKGLKSTQQNVLTILEDYYFDLRFGLNTTRWVNLDHLKINSENKHRGRAYQPTRLRPFKKLMDRLDFPKDSIFVDFGAGKGRVLLAAGRYGFRKIVGVEFSPELCQEARKNLDLFKQKTDLNIEVEIIEADAAYYQIADGENIFFMFNPFDNGVMSKLLENVQMSLQKNPRKIWLIYNNPIYQNTIEQQGNFIKLLDYGT